MRLIYVANDRGEWWGMVVYSERVDCVVWSWLVAWLIGCLIS